MNQYQEYLRNKKYRLTANVPVHVSVSEHVPFTDPITTTIVPSKQHVHRGNEFSFNKDNSEFRHWKHEPSFYSGVPSFIIHANPDPLQQHAWDTVEFNNPNSLHTIPNVPSHVQTIYHLLRKRLDDLYHRNIFNPLRMSAEFYLHREPSEYELARMGRPGIIHDLPTNTFHIFNNPRRDLIRIGSPGGDSWDDIMADITGRHIGVLRGLRTIPADFYEENIDPKLGDVRHLGIPLIDEYKKQHKAPVAHWHVDYAGLPRGTDINEDNEKILSNYYYHYGNVLRKAYNDFRHQQSKGEPSFHRFIRSYKLPAHLYSGRDTLHYFHRMLLKDIKDMYDPRHISKHYSNT